ncbi:MAG: helix-hairpin-helix domain-containing protein, partial [bacterium]|nr:helix-hairpin-helix domain-containing protein [bacterium]
MPVMCYHVQTVAHAMTMAGVARIPGPVCHNLEVSTMITVRRAGQSHRGVALIAVLSVLTILALLAASFAVLMSVEQDAGRVSMTRLQAECLTKSALEHAQAILRQDIMDQPGWDDPGELWGAAFAPGKNSGEDVVEIDGTPNANGQPGDARWIYVHLTDGTLAGRYAIMVQDEAGKINVNSASALSPRQQHQGVGTFETMLTDGSTRGLPISLAFGQNILAYRYGRDRAPGQRGVDDNYTAAQFAADEIDNNANGVIDEPDEGIDEPEEFNALQPAWDDRSFSSLQEVASKASGGKELNANARRMLRQSGTVYTRTRDAYFDEQTRTWQRQINLNVGSRDQVTKLLRAANDVARFEPVASRLQNLIANVIDYRDENHVLSTVGAEYGVEAVCFNEIMANDGSYTVEADHCDPAAYDQYHLVHRLGRWYNLTGSDRFYGWTISAITRAAGGTFINGGKREQYPDGADVQIGTDIINPGGLASKLRDFKKLQSELGSPGDLWKNCYLKLWNQAAAAYSYYPVIKSAQNRVTVGLRSVDEFNALSTTVWSSARLDTLWRVHDATYSVFPRASDCWWFPTQWDRGFKPPDNLHYLVYIGEQNFEGNTSDTGYPFTGTPSGPWKGYNRMLDVDGDLSRNSESEMLVLRQSDLKNTSMEIPGGKQQIDLLRWAYQDGKSVQAKNGYVRVLLTSGNSTGFSRAGTSNAEAYRNKSAFDIAYIMRPDIIELINISARPISMRNWRVVINTGAYADQVGLIESAPHYSLQSHKFYDDPNPSIPPNGYFYLTNNREIFDKEYGSRQSGTWGDSQDEAYPCFELPDSLWGVRYKVTRVQPTSVTVSGSNWRPDQMKYEMVEFHTKRTVTGRNGLTGVRKVVLSNTRDTLSFVLPVGLVVDGVQAGDDAVIVGMPHAGGFLSMTLKDEYNQIAARTIEYGSTEPDEINYSTEKQDPTHYNWVKSRRATFGGTQRLAKNHSMPTGTYVPAFVKDNQYVSIGEIQQVRKSEDWQNIGSRGRGAASTVTLKAIGKYFTVAGVRLDPEEAGAHVQGWKPAFGLVASFGNGGVTTENAHWEPGQWDNQTLRMLSGPQKGESFAIAHSTQNGVTVAGYSVPSGAQLRIKKGDQFSVGPGYATPFYYTRQNGDVGVWEWQNKGLERNSYGLYLYGLCDSIDTTEFLEENFNAGMEVSAWNFETQAFDQLPLPGERRTGRAGDAYEIVSGRSQHQYEKNDGAYIGKIHPQHISPKNGIRLQIVARGLNAKRCSGTAWFDYAYLAPGSVFGKININSASERVLSALPGVTPELAHNIALGFDNTGRAQLKPYKSLTDVLNVRGLTTEIFSQL